MNFLLWIIAIEGAATATLIWVVVERLDEIRDELIKANDLKRMNP